MNLTREDQIRIWKALASYISECEALKESDNAEFYEVEIQETKELRKRFPSAIGGE